jgi:hypothetical protein
MSRTVWALKTSNSEAQALIRRAQDRCEGCRLSWRIRRNWKHGEPMPIECTAKTERQALRDIAARNKGKECA